MGSLGNGGAMRAAPLGAYFAEDPERLVVEARKSAEVTHYHPEGQAGAVAVALAAAFAWVHRDRPPRGRYLLGFVEAYMPHGDTRDGILRAIALEDTADVQQAAVVLGTGARVSSAATVPFSLWCASRHLKSYEEALWETVSGLGDRDTTCAIVGGIVVMSAGLESIPDRWLTSREGLPMAFMPKDTA